MINKDGIEEFQVLYKKEFGIILSDDESARRAESLLHLYRAVYVPPRKDGEQCKDT